MVLAGGPDRERPVSLESGAAVAAALRQAGHLVLHTDPSPVDGSYLDAFLAWGGDVVFPALHGAWGEGGAVQRLMDERGVRYVGCGAAAAALCMDKVETKRVLEANDVPTPAWELCREMPPTRVAAPLVLKPVREGSSVDLRICKTRADVDDAWADLCKRHDSLLAEAFVKGREMTVGVLAGEPLPPIQIVPATEFYSYDAKYERDDTQYLVGRSAIDLPGELLDRLSELAKRAYDVLGCRHLSRVDFIVDEQNNPWVLEVNTMPGFTGHSLLPMAAAHAGIELPALLDRLVRMGPTTGLT